MALTYQFDANSANVDLLTTELNALAVNTTATSSVGGTSGVFDNQVGGDANMLGYTHGVVVCRLAALASACTTNPIGLWFLRSWDNGTTFEAPPSGSPPNRSADVYFFPSALATAQNIVGVNGTGDPPGRESTSIRLPAGKFKCLFYWAGGGVALGATGNVVEVLANAMTTQP